MNLDQAMAIAVGHHQAGRLREAEAIYRLILKQLPDDVRTLGLLGALMGQRGDFPAAEEFLKRVIAIDPKAALAHSNLGNALRDQGKLAEAAENYAKAAELEPAVVGFFNLGLTLSELGKLEEAEAAYSKAIALDPQDADVRCNRGNVLKDLGRLTEAIGEYEEAIALRPEFALAYFNMGVALGSAKKHNEAIVAYQWAVEFDPGLAEAHFSLGNELCEKKDLEGAVEAYRRAIELRPGYAEAHANLGNALMKQAKWSGEDKLDHAVEEYCAAVALKPDFAEAHANLGNARKEQRRLDEAMDCYERSMTLRPADAALHSNRVYTAHFHPLFDAAAILKENLEWDRRHGATLRAFWPAHENDRSVDRRLRVGYVSPDFCSHPIGRFLLPLLDAHDRGNVEVFCYSDVRVPDEMSRQIAEQADKWRYIAESSDEQAAELIRSDQIDVLVDLTMHMAGNRLTAFCGSSRAGTNYLSGILLDDGVGGDGLSVDGSVSRSAGEGRAVLREIDLAGRRRIGAIGQGLKRRNLGRCPRWTAAE